MVTWRRPTALPLIAFGQPDQGYDTARVTSPFGWRDNPLYPAYSSTRRLFHGGLDIGNHRAGDQVVAAGAGTVLAEGALLQPWSIPAPAGSGWWGGNYGGLMVVIDHGSGRRSIYAHLRKTVVSAGDVVRAGQLIGEIGDTGAAKGQAHLHFGIQVNGVDVDPWPLINPAPIVAGAGDHAGQVSAFGTRYPSYVHTDAQALAWVNRNILRLIDAGKLSL